MSHRMVHRAGCACSVVDPGCVEDAVGRALAERDRAEGALNGVGDRRIVVGMIDDLVREHRALTLPLVNDLVDAMAGLLHARLEEQKVRGAKERERLRSALAHEIYRNHEHTAACSACAEDEALLR